MLVMKTTKRHMTEVVELPNQENIRTLGEKETYKYLGILEGDRNPIFPSICRFPFFHFFFHFHLFDDRNERKKNEKSISEEPEDYSRQNSIAGTLSKG